LRLFKKASKDNQNERFFRRSDAAFNKLFHLLERSLRRPLSIEPFFVVIRLICMKNNALFADRIERLILADKLTQAGAALLVFLTAYQSKYPSESARNLKKQVTEHIKQLNDLDNLSPEETATQVEKSAAIEKNIWISFNRIKDEIRHLEDLPDVLATHEEVVNQASGYTLTYAPKPQTWRDAPWLPLLVAGAIVGVIFTIGMSYNNGRLKAKKAAEQAAIDVKNGVNDRITEGVGALKLLEQKTVVGIDESLVVTVKSVKTMDSTLTIVLNYHNKGKIVLQNPSFILVDVEAKGQQTQAAKTDDWTTILPDTNPSNVHEKAVTINYAIGEHRKFLLICKFVTTDTRAEKSMAIPFQLR
jgi:phage host-nuclease inhibitor protein Gam